MLLGNKETIGFEVGEYVKGSPKLRYLEIWLCAKRITEFDNVAHIPTLVAACDDDAEFNLDLNKHCNYLRKLELEDAHSFILSTRDIDSENYGLEEDDLFLNHQVFNWGPNTDKVFCFLINQNGQMYLTVSDNSEQVLKAPITKEYFVSTLHQLSVELQK